MLESAESEMIRLISREIIFAKFEPTCILITIPQRYRQTDKQTDGQTTCLGNTALRVASRGKNYSSAFSFLNDLLFGNWQNFQLYLQYSMYSVRDGTY